MSYANINLTDKNRIKIVAALALSPQATCPIPAGQTGRWMNTAGQIFERDAAGVDSAGQAVKRPCRLATAAALGTGVYDATAQTFTQTTHATENIDSVAPAVGDRILVKNQVDQTQNGIYTLTVLGTGSVKQVLTRATDANESGQFQPSFLVPVSEGSVNADTVFMFTSDAPFVLDTNNAVFTSAPLAIVYGAAGDMAAAGNAAANAAGVSSKVARTDHVHAQGKVIAGASTNLIADPGTAQAIPVTASGVCAITTAAAETNTLADPTFVGQVLDIIIDTQAVGARVITAASRINQAGNTIMTGAQVGDYIRLVAITIAGARKWQVAANDGFALS
jgi:hypothetical protein